MAEGDYARSVNILVNIAGNPEQKLDNINQKLDQLGNKKVGVGDSAGGLNKLTGGAGEATNSVKKLNDVSKESKSLFQSLPSPIAEIGNTAKSAFGDFSKAIQETNQGVGALVANLSAIAIGGSLAGIAWLDEAKSSIYIRSVNEAIDANEKLNLSSADVNKSAMKEQEAGWKTYSQAMEDKGKIISLLGANAKKVLGTGLEANENITAIEKFYLKHQIAFEKGGISLQSFVQQMSRQGKTPDRILKNYQMVMPDFEKKDFASPTSRFKKILKEGGAANEGEIIEEEPWIRAETNMKRLKESIGEGIGGPMATLTKGFADLVNIIDKIPAMPAFLGYAGILLAGAGALGLFAQAVSPVWQGLAKVVGYLFAESTAVGVSSTANLYGVATKQAQTVANEEVAISSVMATSATRSGAVAAVQGGVAAQFATVANTGLAASAWAVLSPLLLIALPLIIIGGILYLLETRTHVFSNALKELSKTQMAKDLMNWFKDVGYWIDIAANGLGRFLSSGISKVGALYGQFKSGGGFSGAADSYNKKQTETGTAIGLAVKNAFSSAQSKVSDATIEMSNSLRTIARGPINLITSSLVRLDTTLKWIWDLLNRGWSTITGLARYFTGGISKNEQRSLVSDLIVMVSKLPGAGGLPGALGMDTNKYPGLAPPKTKTPNIPPEKNEEEKKETPTAKKESTVVIDTVVGLNNAVGLGDKAKEAGETGAKIYAEGGDAALGDYYNGLLGVATGGFINKGGIIRIHDNETVIPAEVTRSSRLQTILESIATGQSSAGSNTTIVNMNYTAPVGSGSAPYFLDKFSFERAVKEIVGRNMRNYGSY